MKKIKYQFITEVNHGTEEEPNIVQTLRDKEIQCSDDVFEANFAIAKAEAYNGEVTVEEVPDTEPTPTPSGDLENRVAAVEHDVADLTAAVEKGLSL